jgi:hypothetical protein
MGGAKNLVKVVTVSKSKGRIKSNEQFWVAKGPRKLLGLGENKQKNHSGRSWDVVSEKIKRYSPINLGCQFQMNKRMIVTEMSMVNGK